MKYLYLLIILLPIPLSAGQWVETHYIHNELVKSIHCPDTVCCYTLVQDDLYTLLYKTSDQGKTWNMVYKSDPFNEGKPILINAKDGSSPNPAYFYIAMQETGFLKISSDSGKSFFRIDLDYDHRIREVEMLDKNFGIAIADLAYFITYDGWKTFEKFEHASQNPEMKGNIECPVILNRNYISMLLHTSNFAAYVRLDVNAKEWAIVYKFQTDSSGYFSPDDLFFVNDTLAYAAGRFRADTSVGHSSLDAIYRTKDGGETWEELIHQSHSPRFGLQEIAFKDERHGIAVGQFGKIIRTTDGGDSWTYDKVPEVMKENIPPTMKIAWAGETPIIGTYSAGFWRYEEPVGIKEIINDKDIKIKRNNNQMLISIEDESFTSYNVLIINVNGRILKRAEISSGKGTVFKPINIEDISNGVYFYSISNGRKIKTGGFTIIR